MAAIGNQAAHGETASQRQPAVGLDASIPVDATLDLVQKRGAATVGLPAAIEAGAPIGQRTAVVSCMNEQRGPERPGPNSIDHCGSGLVFF